MKEKIEQALKETALDGRITCAQARRVAERLEVTYLEVGKTTDALNIRIKNCELGCF